MDKKPEEKKDTFEFDKNNLKEEKNVHLSDEAKKKNKKADDELLDRFANFSGEMF